MQFTENFFQRETICNFEVPEMMKRAWAAEMEILEAIIDICDRHGLQYFADGGTLLGAVRHQGFIPWDDDIDLCMKREDYRKLVQILPQELPPGIAMAGMYADTERMRRASFHPYIQILPDQQYWDFNGYMKRFHGFPYPKFPVEIFPLDYLPRDPELQKIQSHILVFGFYLLDNWIQCEKNGKIEEILSFLENLSGQSIPRNDNTQNFLWRLLDNISALYQEEESDELTNYYYYLQIPGFHFKKEWYSETVRLPFEQMDIMAPCGWHEILTASYGNYMSYDKSMIFHNYPFYGNQEQDLVRRIQDLGFSGTVEAFCQKVSMGDLHVLEDRKKFWD